MSCSRCIASLAAAVLICGTAVAQGSFEGVVTGSYFGDNGNPVADYTQTLKAGRSRMDTQTEGTTVSMIMDLSGGTMTTLMHEQRMYMVMDMRGMGQAMAQRGERPSEDARPPRITPTGQTETIAGHTCEHYLMGDEQEMDVCAAKGMGFGLPGMGGGRGMMGMGGMDRAPQLPAGYEQLQQMFQDGFFPLQIETIKNGRRRMVMQVKTVEAKPVPESAFQVPDGYRKIAMPGMR